VCSCAAGLSAGKCDRLALRRRRRRHDLDLSISDLSGSRSGSIKRR
jgi:hypothetical protein